MSKLEYYGGQGYGYSKEIGKFQVTTDKTVDFNRLSEAIKYYESLNEEKSIWDVTHSPELLDAMIKL